MKKKKTRIAKPLSRAEINDIVGDILMRATYVAKPEGGFHTEQGLNTELGMDSVEILEVLIACDETFGIDIQDDVDSLQTVGDLCDIVENCLYPDGNPWN